MSSLTNFLFACCGLLVAAIFVEIIYYDPLSSTPVSSINDKYNGEKQDTRRELEFPPMSYFSEIKNRPLFNASRRPTSAVFVEQMPAYRLRGALLRKEKRVALLERRSDGVIIRVTEGVVVDGWQIISINNNEVKMRQSHQTHAISLAQTLSENISFDDIRRREQVYNDDALQGEKIEEETTLENLNRRDDHADRECLQRECRAVTSETRMMKQTLAGLIAPLVSPPPPPPPQVLNPDRY